MRSRPTRLRAILPLLFLALITALFLVPAMFVSEAQNKGGNAAEQRPAAGRGNALANYDIRTDKAAYNKIAALRGKQNLQAADVADVRDGFARGEQKLRARVPSLKVEYNHDLRVPEVITPDVREEKSFLTNAQAGRRSDILKSFLKENADLVGVAANQTDELTVFSDYTNPDGNLSFVELTQEIDGIPVFRGEVKAGFTKRGELVRIVNNLAPGLEKGNVSSDFGDPSQAVRIASDFADHQLRGFDLDLKQEQSSDIKTVFGGGDFATTAEKMYFPLEPGVAVPSWRVLLWQDDGAYYVIVDANSGDLLWRKNLTEHQTQAVTYNVYANPNAMINVADNPFPLTPGPITPDGTQAGALARTLVTRIGNEAPFTFNNLGWITDGNNTLDGNNVQAGLDRESPNNGTNPSPNDIDPNGVPSGSSNRVFDFPFNPGVPTGTATTAGDSPLPTGQSPATCQAVGTATAPTDYQKAVTTQLFYITNAYHDEMYRLGFTEAARNFQQNNFGRGGVGNDRVSAQAQDCSGSNNANFTTPSDGGRPTMQMYLFTNPTPDFDGSLDADIVIHELTHGTSNRLHGNSAGLGGLDISRAMGEGWSDFYGHAMLSEPADPINGVYPTGGYATYRLRGTNFSNYYYGIRRFPKAVMASTGGPNNRPHNPLTFADLDPTKFNVGDGAFGPAFTAQFTDGVHAGGEIWSSALWEVRAKMIERLGPADGNRRVLQLVTDGMKLAPLNPTFLSERDAIIAAALASGSPADVKDLWAGFAIRGMGASASIQIASGSSPGGTGTGTTRVTEAFDLPNLQQTPAISVSDSIGDNDGSPEPGESVLVTVPLSNTTGEAASNVSASIVGGGTVSYGTIANGGAASNQIRYTIPAASACGSALNMTINVTSSLGPVSFTRTLILGSPNTTLSQNFDSVAAPAFPAGWTAVAESGGLNFVNSTLFADSAPNSAFAANPTTIGGGTSLTSPAIAIAASAAIVNFRNRYDTEVSWDGGVLEISINGGAFQDIITAGGSFLQNGYNGILFANGVNNPLAGRSAWNGNSNGFITSSVRLPAAAAGQNVQLRWRFGADDNTTGVGPNPGWSIDSVTVVGSYTCSNFASRDVRSDFDGDGQTDVSVFRPSNGTWYLLGSEAGFSASQWGASSDVLVPADYDQDGATDVAIYRPAPNNSAFYVLKSSDFTVTTSLWGTTGDVPVVRDYDGDTVPDVAIYRPSTGFWYIYGTTAGFTAAAWGAPGDIPIAGDFDGDGKGDFTVYRNGQWITLKSSGGATIVEWGLSDDQPVPADYDGDEKDDIAIYRPGNGVWCVLRSSDGGFTFTQWGNASDKPAPGDYDGDRQSDIAVYRSGEWHILKSSGGYQGALWGNDQDKPTMRGYLP